MSNLKRDLLPVRVFAKIAVLRVFRDKTALFFSFAFPLIFLFIFGGIFGKTNGHSFKVALLNQSHTVFSQQFIKEVEDGGILKVDTTAKTLPDAKEKMNRGQLDATIILPPDFGNQKAGQPYPSGQAEILYTQNNATAGQILTTVLRGQFKAINAQFVKVPQPFTVSAQQTNDKSLSQFDYVFSGLLGFTILGIGIFGPINVFPELKKQGVLRRLHTTPLHVWQYFVANVLSQSVVGLMTMTVMFAVAMSVFHLKLAGNVFELAGFLVLSIAAILGIGLAIGGWAKSQQQAAPLSNIVIFPMMFLSGTFFPRFLMPEWLQKVSTFLPLTPVIDGVRLMATEGKSIIGIAPQVGLLLGWIVVIYVIAFRVFRWE